METLAAWYPGDDFLCYCLEVLGIIAMVILAVSMLEKTLARRRPAWASALWFMGLCGVLLAPAVAFLGPQLPWRVTVLALTPETKGTETVELPTLAAASETDRSHDADNVVSVSRPQPTGSSAPRGPRPTLERKGQSGVSSTPVQTPIQPPAPAASTYLRATATLALTLWALGSIWLSIRLLIGARRLRQLRTGLRPLPARPGEKEMALFGQVFGLSRFPEICVSPQVRSPLVAGLIHPCIILPEVLAELSTPLQLREILVHEYAHVLRRDPWIRLLQRLAVILFWVHPLLPLLNRRLDQAREEVCDNYVLADVNAPDYADTLLTVARICYPTPKLEGYVTMLPRRPSLEQRIANLLAEDRDRALRLPLTKRLALAAVLLLVLAGAAGLGFQRAARAQEDKAPAPLSRAASPIPAADAKTEAAVQGTVVGRVLHAADNMPVRGADVRLRIHRPLAGEPPLHRTTSNAQGEFTFAGVAPGEYDVWSFHGNLASRSRRWQLDQVQLAPDGTSRPVILKLRPGIAVRVTVLDKQDGKPLAGALVRLVWTNTDTDRDHIADARGQVELLALTPETWHIEASAKDHAAVSQNLNLASGQPAAMELRLPPGGALEGRITGEDGQPIARVGVNVYPSPTDPAPLDYVEADAQGRYRLDNLPLDRTMKLLASKLDYLILQPEFRIDAGKERVVRLDLVLRKRAYGGSIRGLVLDSSGRPVAGAQLANHGRSSDEVRRTTTNAQGRFQLDNVYREMTDHHVIVKAKGFAPQRVGFTPGTADRPSNLTISLDAGHRIRGRVVNEAGKPIAGVRVEFAHGISDPTMQLGDSTTTDAQGRFRFDSLPANTPFTFMADGYSQIHGKELPLDGDDEVVVTLQVQGVIRGRVLDMVTGKAVSRLNIRLNFSPDAQPGEPRTGFLWQRMDPGEDFVSPKGEFLLKDLTAGMPLQLSVTAPGYRRHVLRRVVAEAGAQAAPLEIRLIPEDSAKLVPVCGKVLDHRNQPVGGAELRLLAVTERLNQRPTSWGLVESGQIKHRASVLQFRQATTGPDGSFAFEGVPGDCFIDLIYWGKGIPRGRRERLENLSTKERGNLVIKALAPARITGTIDPKTFPAFSSIQLMDGFWLGGAYKAQISEDRKHFTIEDLPPGDYEICVYGPAERLRDQPGGFTTRLLGSRRITLGEGKQEQASLGSGDQGQPRPR